MAEEQPDYVGITSRGRPKLVKSDYGYVQDKRGRDEIVYWKCESRDEFACNGRLRTDAGLIVAYVGSHNHAPGATRAEVVKALTDVKEKAKSSQDSSHHIVTSATNAVSQEAVVQLPSGNALKRKVQRTRVTAGNVPPAPASLLDLQLPDRYLRTHTGDDCVLHDAGPEAGQLRCIVFASADSMRMLRDAKSFHMDGTFKCVPLLFSQLYTILARNGEVLPAAYCLQPNKTSAMYERIFQALLNHTPGLQPDAIHCDFGIGATNAAKTKFPDANVRGCFFHLSQNVYKRIQTAGLQERYGNDVAFALRIRMLTALAFVREADVPEYYQILEDEFPEEAEEVITYFKEYYIGRLRNNGTRRTPLFSHALWNVHNDVLNKQPRTNNAQEGWHRRFASQVNCHHPSIWKIITNIADKEQHVHQRREQLVAGHAAPGRKKRYVDRDAKILRIVQSYDSREPLEFLRGIAHNLSFRVSE